MSSKQQPATAQQRAVAQGIIITGDGTYPATGQRFWSVYNPTNGHEYLVTQHGYGLTCSCPARVPCKHVAAVQASLAAEREQEPEPINWLGKTRDERAAWLFARM